MFYKTFIAGFCMLVSSAWCASNNPAFEVGTKFPPSLQGCTYEGGWLEGVDEAGTNLGMRFTVCGTKKYLSLDRLTHYDENRNPHWEVVDFVALPKLRKGESIGESFDCTYVVDGKVGVVTIGTWRAMPNKSYASHITFAVRPNHKTLKIESLNPKQVKCEFFEDRD